jgi:hypothetical protein
LLFSFKNKKRDIENYSGASAGRLLAYRAPLFSVFEKIRISLFFFFFFFFRPKLKEEKQKGKEKRDLVRHLRAEYPMPRDFSAGSN